MNGWKVTTWMHQLRWIGPKFEGLPKPRNFVCTSPVTFAQLIDGAVEVGVGVGVGGRGVRVGVALGVRVGVPGTVGVPDGTGVTSGVSSPGVTIGVAV
jgi:hypothetical protein